MMKKHMCKKGVCNLLTLMIVLSVSVAAAASDEGYALLIQSSPPDGGVVSPGMGVHKPAIGQTVALSATPKKGYRFLYWLGDVSSTSGPDTTVSIDSPKLVVAVFSREDFDEELPGAGITDGQYGGGGGRGRGFVDPLRSPASVSPARKDGRDGRDGPQGPAGEDGLDGIDGKDFIPDDGIIDDIPVPGDNEIPEPATVLLLGLGSSVLLKRMRK